MILGRKCRMGERKLRKEKILVLQYENDFLMYEVVRIRTLYVVYDLSQLFEAMKHSEFGYSCLIQILRSIQKKVNYDYKMFKESNYCQRLMQMSAWNYGNKIVFIEKTAVKANLQGL